MILADIFASPPNGLIPMYACDAVPPSVLQTESTIVEIAEMSLMGNALRSQYHYRI